MKAAWFKNVRRRKTRTRSNKRLCPTQKVFCFSKRFLSLCLRIDRLRLTMTALLGHTKMADRIGYNRALTQVLDLINLDKE